MFSNHFYYQIKPFIPWHLRILIRRFRAKKILQESHDVWPINENAKRKPNSWVGWPNKKKFAFILTHDVESRKGLDKTQQLAELEMEFNLRSSFNFIPEGSYKVSKDFRKWLMENGFEVGVHDLHHDGHLYKSKKEFKQKAKKINHYLKEWEAVGFRSGFMLRELDWIHELNIKYDASTFDTDPFEPQPDGAKTIYPFFVENNQCKKSYVELPYTLPQDSTLYITFGEKTSDIWKEKLRWIAENGGMALVNIHPDYINFNESKSGMRHSLKQIFGPSDYSVERVREFFTLLTTEYCDAFWNPLPSELASWFAANFENN